MWPRAGVIEPDPVSARSYFSQAELDRAGDFRGGQRALYGGSLLIQGGLLILLVRRPPRWLRRRARWPVLAGAAAGAGSSLALAVAPLPLSAIAHSRAVDVGLSTQAWGEWAADVARSDALGALLAAAGAALALALIRRFPRHWWAPGSVALVAVGALLLYAGPVVIAPLFNRFERLPPGPVRSDVLELAERAGVTVGEVYTVDASRRNTAANAYVTGLGGTKRVVLYDNLIERFPREQLRLVLAHELAHVRHRDVQRGLLWLALVAPAALLAIKRLSERFGASDERATAAAVPALALSLALVALALTTISHQLSRRVELRADSFALRLTNAPQAFVALQRGLVLRNVADPDPPGWVTALLGTHPPAIERIGAAVAYGRRRT